MTPAPASVRARREERPRRRGSRSTAGPAAASPDPEDAAWTEVRAAAVPVAREDVTDVQDRLLVEAVEPFARGGDGTDGGGRRRVVFLRDRVGECVRLRVWVRGAGAAEADALAREMERAAERAGRPLEVTVAPGCAPDVGGATYAGPLARRVFVDLLADAAPLLLEQVAAVAAGRVRRAEAALDLMTAQMAAVNIAHAFPGRYPRANADPAAPAAFAVFRAHADGFIVMSRDPAAARAQFDERYQRTGARVRQRVGEVLAQFGAGPAASPSAARWHALAREHLLRAEAAVSAGTLTVRWDAGYLGDTHNLAASVFHQVVQRAPGLRALLRADSGYLAARTLMSGLYLALGALGLRLVDRVFLCHAVARACEDLYGLDATSVVRNLFRALSGGPRRGRLAAAVRRRLARPGTP